VVSFAYNKVLSDIAFVHVLFSQNVNCQRLNQPGYGIIDDDNAKRESK
jgi:hypothetical protein